MRGKLTETVILLQKNLDRGPIDYGWQINLKGVISNIMGIETLWEDLTNISLMVRAFGHYSICLD